MRVKHYYGVKGELPLVRTLTINSWLLIFIFGIKRVKSFVNSIQIIKVHNSSYGSRNVLYKNAYRIQYTQKDWILPHNLGHHISIYHLQTIIQIYLY